MENFREIAAAFRGDNALVEVGSGDELAEAIVALLADDVGRTALGARALALVERNRGSVGRTVDALAGLVA